MGDLVAGTNVELIEAGELPAGARSGFDRAWINIARIDRRLDRDRRYDSTLTTGQGFVAQSFLSDDDVIEHELHLRLAAEHFVGSRRNVQTKRPPQVFQAKILRDGDAQRSIDNGVCDAPAEPQLKPLGPHAGRQREPHARHDLHIVPGHKLIHACAQS